MKYKLIFRDQNTPSIFRDKAHIPMLQISLIKDLETKIK